MIRALAKADQVGGFWGRKRNCPAKSCPPLLFHLDEEIKKEGICKGQTSLCHGHWAQILSPFFSNALPLSLSLSLSLSRTHSPFLPLFLPVLFFFCAFSICLKVPWGHPLYPPPRALVVRCVPGRGSGWGGGGGGGGGAACVTARLEIAQYCPRLYQTSKKDTQTHSPSRWLWVVLPRLPLSIFQIEREKKQKKQKNKKTRGEKAVWNES